MTLHEWVACACGGLWGGPGFWLMLNGFPWGGLLLVLAGLAVRYMVLGKDLDNSR